MEGGIKIMIMEASGYEGKWEKRWHPLRQEWVVYAAHRNHRPWSFERRGQAAQAPAYDPGCYLCPGNPRVSGKQNPHYPHVYIFENDHPVVGLHAPALPPYEDHDGVYKKGEARGIAKVVCYDPRHNVTLTDMEVQDIAAVFMALREEMKFFMTHPDIRSVLIFENKGEIVGVSNPHPHCQIYATDFVFNVVGKELKAMEDHHRETGRNIFEDIIRAEQKDQVRVIAENAHAIAFIPFFARFAYETYIFPKRRHATLVTMTDEELTGLAAVYQEVTRKFDGLFSMPFPYIMAFDQAPVDGGDYAGYHMHLNICPPLRQPGLQKFLAGPETGADTFMADTMPEEKAAELNRVELRRVEKFEGVSPGRLDVMGGIADYSGSLLLQMPIAEETRVTLTFTDSGRMVVETDADVSQPYCEVELAALKGLDLNAFGQYIKALPGGEWAVYVLGCFRVLEETMGLQARGARISVHSRVPAGKGVSSSAAIEVATMQAIRKAYGLHIDPLDLSLWAQRVENLIVGAACGLMDQLSVNLGKKDHLLPIICQPYTVFNPIPIPPGIRFVGLDSGVRHAVSGASYGDVRTAAFMGYVMAMTGAGLDPIACSYHGYLANIPLDEFERTFARLIPERITGAEYLDRFRIHIDPVTTVIPEKTYHTLACARHPVEENHRIRRFMEIMTNAGNMEEAGRLMLASHRGYQQVGLGEAVTDQIVALVEELGLGKGIAGARISGGGSGGTVTMMLTSEQGYAQMQEIRRQVEASTGKALTVFEGSSDGAHYR